MSQHDPQLVAQATAAAQQSYLAWYWKAVAEQQRQAQLAAIAAQQAQQQGQRG